MNIFSKILFFFFVIVIGFVPGGIFISFALLVLYYLPQILKPYIKDSDVILNDVVNEIEPEEMQSYSDGTLEEMK